VIPKCLERKLGELESICSEHGLSFDCVVIDDAQEFLCHLLGDQDFPVAVAAILLSGMDEEEGDPTEVLEELDFGGPEAFRDLDSDEEDLLSDLEDLASEWA